MKKAYISKLTEHEYAVSEALNMLATNLSFSGEGIKCIEVTSRFASEGKTTVALNLARVFSALGKRVVLLDTDLRRSKMTERLGLKFEGEEPKGLAHYLSAQCEIADCLYVTNVPNLVLLPTGRKVSSSLPLLSSPRMAKLMQYLRSMADIVIVDSAPVGAIVDALEVAKHCDGTVVVVGYKQGHCRELQDLKRNIERSHCRVLGAVLNQVPGKVFTNRRYYYTKYGYYTSYYKTYDAKDDQ